MSQPGEKRKVLTIRDIIERKKASRKIVMVTAYDALFGRLVDEAEVDIVLVGGLSDTSFKGWTRPCRLRWAT